MERDLREMMNRQTEALRTTPAFTRAVVRRGRIRLAGTIALAGAFVLALIVGGVAASRTLVVDQSLPPAGRHPVNGKIVVVGRDYSLFKVDPKTFSSREFLSPGPRHKAFSDYTWSPDGSRIAFLFGWPSGRFEVGKMSLYVANADGSGMHRIVRCPKGRTCDFDSKAGISWSPDGTQIALSADGNLYVVDVDGKSMQRVPDGGVFVEDPAWSPDGSWIAFALDRLRPVDEAGLYVVRPDGSDITKLTGLASASHPDWSPDGAGIVFSAFDGLHVVERDGSDMRHLVRAASYEDMEAPSWSPDGTGIAYLNDGVWTVRADGTAKSRLYVPDNPARFGIGGAPVWSPDGKYIAFSFETDQIDGVIVTNKDGTDRRMWNGGTIAAQPAWQPIRGVDR